jgi:hypothetical protein
MIAEQGSQGPLAIQVVSWAAAVVVAVALGICSSFGWWVGFIGKEYKLTGNLSSLK